MSNTIREEQIEMLRQSLSKPQFKASFAYYEATGRPLGVCHPSGHWGITNEDLQSVLNAAYPGLTGEVHNEYLAIWKPLSQLR